MLGVAKDVARSRVAMERTALELDDQVEGGPVPIARPISDGDGALPRYIPHGHMESLPPGYDKRGD